MSNTKSTKRIRGGFWLFGTEVFEGDIFIECYVHKVQGQFHVNLMSAKRGGTAATLRHAPIGRRPAADAAGILTFTEHLGGSLASKPSSLLSRVTLTHSIVRVQIVHNKTN